MAQPRCMLLSLPAEIRNKIYHFVFRVATNKTSRVILRRHSNECNRPKQHSVLDVLQTCKQINQEAATIFYFINNIAFVGHGVTRFVKAVNVEKLDAVTSITLLDVKYAHELESFTKQLQSFQRLKSLTISFFFSGDMNEFEDIAAPKNLTELRNNIMSLPCLNDFTLLEPRAGSYRFSNPEIQYHLQTRCKRVLKDLKEASQQAMKGGTVTMGKSPSKGAVVSKVIIYGERSQKNSS